MIPISLENDTRSNSSLQLDLALQALLYGVARVVKSLFGTSRQLHLRKIFEYFGSKVHIIICHLQPFINR